MLNSLGQKQKGFRGKIHFFEKFECGFQKNDRSLMEISTWIGGFC